MISSDELAALLGFRRLWSRSSSRTPLSEAVKGRAFQAAGVYLKDLGDVCYIGETERLSSRMAKYLSQGENPRAVYFIEKTGGRRALEAAAIKEALRLGAPLSNIRLNSARGSSAGAGIDSLEPAFTPSALKAHFERIADDECLYEERFRRTVEEASPADRRAYEAFRAAASSEAILWLAAEIASVSAPGIFRLAPQRWSVLLMPPHFDAERRTLLAFIFGRVRVLDVIGRSCAGRFGVEFRMAFDPELLSEADAERLSNLEAAEEFAFGSIPMDEVHSMMKKASFRTAFSSAAVKALMKGPASAAHPCSSIALSALESLAAQNLTAA